VTGLVIVGNTSRDIVDGGPPRVGGGPYHCGRALRALGVRAALVTKLADADDALLQPLRRLGLPLHRLPATSTSAFAIDNDGDGRRMEVAALGDPWTPAEAAAVPPAKWVHVAALARSDFPAETLRELARSRFVSLDGQGLVRPAATGPLEPDADFDPALLRHVRVLKLSEEEASVLGLDFTSDRSLRSLGVPEVVVTLGRCGAVVFADGLAEHVPARTAVARDPTGAGDAFAAAYAAARLGRLGPVQAAGRAAGLVGDLLAGRAA
jgi:ribokinase